MKYGDTLQQWSTPEWGTHNVDYNDIKHMIKTRTMGGQTQAVPIPGPSGDGSVPEEFEDEVFTELNTQHQRVNLFVYSKSGEISRRLTHLGQQVYHLQQGNISTSDGVISMRRLERYSKIEVEVMKKVSLAGEEIRSLSRFVGAQRQAFRKLLKKYRRWTGSNTLDDRFQKEVTGRPGSLAVKDFRPLLDKWTDVLASVRAPFADKLSYTAARSIREANGKTKPARPRTPGLVGNVIDQERLNNAEAAGITSAAQLHATSETGYDVDFDTALAVLPLGGEAGKATYWIHPDNLIEFLVLLLQYMKVSDPNIRSPSGSTPSSRSSRRGSVTSYAREDEYVNIICDDLQRFASRCSGATIDQSEMPGAISETAATTIKYTAEGEAVVVIGNSTDASKPPIYRGQGLKVQKAKLKRKNLPQLFQAFTPSPQDPHPSPVNQVALEMGADPAQTLQRLQKWLSNHRDIQPLVMLQSKRTRFVGLRNSGTHGIWATLDKEVVMRRASSTQLGSDRSIHMDSRDPNASRFPHAILEIRWEGKPDAGVARVLDDSHLTERVRGFSLDTHAVATLLEPRGMPTPFWVAALDRDIRKLPSSAKSNRGLPQPPGKKGTSTSTTSIADRPTSSSFSFQKGESSATSAPDMLQSPNPSTSKKKRRRRKQLHPRRQIDEYPPSQPRRYWNEFDDGDEAPENHTYTIFVDPNAPSTFSNVISSIRCCTRRLWLRLFPQAPDHAFDGQKKAEDISSTDHLSQRTSAEDSDRDDSSTDQPLLTRHRHKYSTFTSQRSNSSSPQRHSDAPLLRTALFSLVAASVLFTVSAILKFLGHQTKEAIPANAGAIVGIVSALVFAVIGLVLLSRRRERIGWALGITIGVFSAVVGAGFLAVVVGFFLG